MSYTQIDWMEFIPPKPTSCKHSKYGCKICGTTERRDENHRTRGGKGRVAQLAERLKKK